MSRRMDFYVAIICYVLNVMTSGNVPTHDCETMTSGNVPTHDCETMTSGNVPTHDCERYEGVEVNKSVMSPLARVSRAKFHWGIAFATGLKRYTDPVTKLRLKHTNLKEMTMISKDGEISKFPGYHSSEEEEPTEQPR
ncbi:hypothetical protein Tco_1432689, partial [Tanacetum coccineum]